MLCKKGDAANEMFLTVSEKFLVTEFGIELPPGSPVGELGFLTPSNERTATVECTEAAQVLTIITKGYWSCTSKTRNSAIIFLC